MIQLSELTKTFGDRVLFDHVTWQITDRERVGLCGPNGAGKTTLLKMMAGIDEPDAGAVLKPNALTVGYLPQDGLNHSGHTVFEEASSAFADLIAMKAEMHAHRGSARRTRRFRKPSTRRCCIATATCRTASGSATATASS